MKNVTNDPFFASLRDFVNDTDIQRLLEEVLEIESNDTFSLSDLSWQSDINKMHYINKVYKNNRKDFTAEELKLWKSVIASALELLHIIFKMIHTLIQLEKDKKARERSMYNHHYHLTSLRVVQSIKDLLVDNTSIASDLDDNRLLLTILSYVQLETKYNTGMNVREDLYDELVSSTVSYEHCKNVSSITLKCLIQIIKIWELYPVSKRPSLAFYLTYENNSFSRCESIIDNAMANPEEAYCMLEFLVCCMNSQIGFINTLFKDEKLFKSVIERFCHKAEDIVRQARRHREIKRVVGILVVLVSQLIQNRKIKSNKVAKEMIKEFLGAYLTNSDDTIHALFINRQDYPRELFDMPIKSSEYRRGDDKFANLRQNRFLEQCIRDICFYNHVVSSYLLIIANLLIAIDKDNENKKLALKCLVHINRNQIFDILRLCTEKRMTNTAQILDEFNRFLYNLNDVNYINYNINEISDQRRTTIEATDLDDLKISLEQLHYASVVENTTTEGQLWKTAQSKFYNNIDGYGRSFVLDRNEFFYVMKNCFYEGKFIEDFIEILGKYNLEMSLLDSERTLISSVHDLFAFVSNLGHDGFLGSIHDKIPTSIKRAGNDVNYGFSFFTIVGGITSKLKKDTFMDCRLKLLRNLGKFSASLWNSLKDDLDQYHEYHIDFNKVLSKSHSQKLNFLRSIFHAKIYLLNLDYSEIDNFEGGSEYITSKEVEEAKRIDEQEEEEITSAITNISVDIIPRLAELLYIRTRIKSDLPTDEQLLSHMFEFIPVFLNNVVEGQVMTNNTEALNRHIINMAKDLRYLLDYNEGKYYNAVVLIYEQIIKVLDDKIEICSLFRMKESFVIKKMMLKLTQKDCTEEQYLSTIKFMIAYSSLQDGALHLFEERITTALISAHCLQNLDEHEYYEIDERNSKHILWLWTLHLMRQLTSMLIHNSEFTYPLIGFVTAFEDRIMRVLQFKGYLDGKKQFKVFSIARLEEIEHTVNLISFIFLNFDQWKANKMDQLERIINILFSFTINLFQSNVALSDCFHPISQFEKYTKNMSGDTSPIGKAQGSTNLLLEEKKGSQDFSNISQSDKTAIGNKIMTSLRTPMKGEATASDFSMLEHDEYSRRGYKASHLGKFSIDKYKPDGFILKVEITLTKIALMLLRSMHLILKNEMKHGSHSNFITELAYFHRNTSETKLFCICKGIFDCIQFSLHCQRKWTSNFDSTNKLNIVLNGATQSTDNLLDSYIDIFDCLEISSASAELGLLLSMLMLKAGQMSTGDMYEKGFLEVADRRLIEKIKSYAQECKLLYEDKEKVIEANKRINRKTYGKTNYPLKKQPQRPGERPARTNAEIIIEKIDKEYKN